MATESCQIGPSEGVSVQTNKRPTESEEESNPKKIHLDSIIDKSGTPKRIKYKNYALLLSYCGKNYYGMQLQRSTDLNTIEDILLHALVEANLINHQGKTSPQNYHFQRASRTDKGVSAVRQVVSMNLPEHETGIPETLNSLLPEEIKIFGAIRVTRSFNSKNWCDSRTYSYLCPTYAFAPLDQPPNEDYRMSPEVLKEINNIFELYVGCHRFHNFTSGKSFSDPSSRRYIISMGTEAPFERAGYEWIRVVVHGHSFMLHQIRKMIGLVMAISKGLTTKEVIETSWGEEKVDVPKAPGLGLVLEQPHFHNYNKKFGSDGSHKLLQWDDVNEDLLAFREKYIDSTIIEAEIKEKSMLSWLETLPLHVYTCRDENNCIQSSEKNGNEQDCVRIEAETNHSNENSIEKIICSDSSAKKIGSKCINTEKTIHLDKNIEQDKFIIADSMNSGLNTDEHVS